MVMMIKKMDQRSIVLDPARKGLSARGICDDLEVTLGPDAKSDGPVTRFLRETKFLSSDPLVTSSKETPLSNDSNEAIRLTLSE
jgi:hypothetical protein